MLALVLMTAGTVLMAEGVPSNAWWLLGAVPCLTSGVAGISVSLSRRTRDDKGSVIR